jgi:hypothetical protein
VNLAPAGDTRIWQGSDFVGDKLPAQAQAESPSSFVVGGGPYVVAQHAGAGRVVSRTETGFKLWS